MKMKKYNAPSIAEAMKMIRADLGEDAIILNSKVVVTKKFFGLVKQKSFEVMAGIDRIESKPSNISLPISPFAVPSEPKNMPKPSQLVEQPIQQHPIAENTGLTDTLKKEIDDLKSLMQSMHRQSLQLQYPDEILPAIQLLKYQELSEELIAVLGDKLLKECKYNRQNLTEKQMMDILRDTLKEQLEQIPIGGITYNHKYINLFGPTGVGKTTTIAKMAARAVLEKKKKVGFITTDTYRVGAIEQLKTYAGLLQAPVEIVYSAQDYEQALKKLSHLDLVFIDTAGRNYKEVKYVDDLQRLISFNEEIASYLVLSITAKQKDMEKIIEQFSKIPIEKLIFTKIDETNSIGTMINLMIKYNKGVAYYTNGQEVPEDIEEASVERLLNLFFQGDKI